MVGFCFGDGRKTRLSTNLWLEVLNTISSMSCIMAYSRYLCETRTQYQQEMRYQVLIERVDTADAYTRFLVYMTAKLCRRVPSNFVCICLTNDRETTAVERLSYITDS